MHERYAATVASLLRRGAAFRGGNDPTAGGSGISSPLVRASNGHNLTATPFGNLADVGGDVGRTFFGRGGWTGSMSRRSGRSTGVYVTRRLAWTVGSGLADGVACLSSGNDEGGL